MSAACRFFVPGKENNHLVALPSEIDTVARTEIDPPFKDSGTNLLHVAEVSLRNAVESGRDLSGADCVFQRGVPLAKRTEPTII